MASRSAIPVVMLSAFFLLTGHYSGAYAETPREKKEAAGESIRPTFSSKSLQGNQQQERQDRARPTPVRERIKPGESQQDARQRKNRDRILEK